MANVIQKLQVPTLVICHNKTLAAQLATEFKHFFPNNAVHYFVSYFDYYQPESYLPEKGLYIEKEATINKEIEMYRLSTLASLLTRKDVLVVASAKAAAAHEGIDSWHSSTVCSMSCGYRLTPLWWGQRSLRESGRYLRAAGDIF